MSKPAPTSSVSVRATSPTTNTLRSRWRRPDEPRSPSFNPSVRFGREACKAGARPKSKPVSSETASVKTNTGASTLGFLQARDAVRQLGGDQTRAPEREQDSQRGAQRGQQDALGQQLTNERGAAGAERHAHRHLLLPRRCAHEQQIGDIGAGDQ